MLNNQTLIQIEGTATYERILADVNEIGGEEGLRHIQDFLKIYPDFARAHNDLAVLYYQSGNSLRALAHYEKANKLDPNNITYRKNLADFYFVELEWSGDAIQTYLGILKDNPFDTEALNALGSISLKIGRKEQARQYFARTLQLDTTNQDAQQALKILGVDRPTALTEPVRKPQQIESLATATPFTELFRLSEPVASPAPAAAQPVLNAGIMQASEPMRSPQELYREAFELASAGNADEAIRILEELLKQDNGHAAAHNDLGVLLQQKGEAQASRCHHEEAVRLQPANKIFQKNLADLLYVEFNDIEGALNIYVTLLAKSQQDIEILKAIATICREIGKVSDARYFLERALTLQPWDRDAQTMLKEMEEAGA